MLNCVFDSVSMLLHKNVEKRGLMDNMDGVFLAVDEICDSGWVLLGVRLFFMLFHGTVVTAIP